MNNRCLTLQILSGLFEFNSPDWDDISYPAKELISWMLQVSMYS